MVIWPLHLYCYYKQSVKKSQIMKQLLLIPMLLLGIIQGVFGQSCPDTVTLAMTSEYVGQELVVRVNVRNFSDITSFQMGIQYDADMVKLLGIASPVPQFGAASYTDYGNGNLRLLWFDPSNDGVNLPDQSDLLTMRFVVIQEASTSFIRITETLFPLEFVDRDGQEWCVETTSVDVSSPGFSLSGKIWNDANENCEADDNETGIAGWLLSFSDNGKTYYRTTDEAGNYVVVLPAGNYRTRAYPINQSWALCSELTDISLTEDLSGQDFVAKKLEACPGITTAISAPYLVGCATMPYTLYYENQGTETATDAYITVDIDEAMQFQDTDFPDYTENGKKITFNLGDLPPFAKGYIKVYLYLDCQQAEAGQTHCVVATAYPNQPCTPVQGWSGALLEITSQCDPASGKVIFNIINTGNGPMISPKTYIVTEDDVLTPPEPVQLEAQQALTLEFPADGTTYRLTANQDNGFPFASSFVTKAVEGCRTSAQQPFSKGFVNMFEESDRDPFKDADCMESSAVLQPSAVVGFPKGYGSRKFIKEDYKLEYTIHFQNTATDTAISVIIKNPVSPLLDMSTLQMGTASHPYTYRINQERELVITFDDILLVDSLTNAPASFGFVRYSIYPVQQIPDGTLLNNDAKIYFDYAVPVRADGEIHTIGSDFFVVGTVWTDANTTADFYPNPAEEAVYLRFTGESVQGMVRYEILSVEGRPVGTGVISDTDQPLSLRALPAGIYMIKLSLLDGRQAILKVVRQ